MLERYLPESITESLNNIPYDAICELRLRSNNVAIVNIKGQNYYLGGNSFTDNYNDAIKVSGGVIKSIIERISNNSMYTINDELISGYVTLSGGIRVGVCGEVVTVNDKVTTIKNISSLNFRFPHFIKNCSLNIYPYIVTNHRVRNTLIISPPGAGKTTYLRDLIYQISNKEKGLNILVVDERDEINSIFNGIDNIKLEGCDVYSKCTKSFGFVNGIRSMRPDVIFTDEINLEKDIEILELALTSGVSVIASIHASSIMDIKNKSSFKSIVSKSLFDRFVILSNEDGVGTLEGVFDENFNFIGV